MSDSIRNTLALAYGLARSARFDDLANFTPAIRPVRIGIAPPHTQETPDHEHRPQAPQNAPGSVPS